MLHQNIVKALKNVFQLNIKTLRNCIIFKYLTKINHYYYSRCMELLITFNASWTCTKKWHNSISETRITKQAYLSNNFDLNNYLFEVTPTKTSAGVTLLYVANHLSCKCRKGLNIYKENELEPTFIESINQNKLKYYCGSHLQTSMDLTDIYDV